MLVSLVTAPVSEVFVGPLVRVSTRASRSFSVSVRTTSVRVRIADILDLDRVEQRIASAHTVIQGAVVDGFRHLQEGSRIYEIGRLVVHRVAVEVVTIIGHIGVVGAAITSRYRRCVRQTARINIRLGNRVGRGVFGALGWSQRGRIARRQREAGDCSRDHRAVGPLQGVAVHADIRQTPHCRYS